MRTFLIVAAGLALSCASSAEETESITRAGTSELSAHISPDFEGAIGDMIFVQGGYGWFIRDPLELRATFSFTLLEDISGDENDYKMRELGAAAEYHFNRDGRILPYVGLGIGWAKSLFADTEESGVTYGPQAGVKCFLADNVALDVALAYRQSSADVFINDFTREDSDVSAVIGLRVLFP